MLRDVVVLAIVVAQVAALIAILELVLGWWRLRRALDDLHALCAEPVDLNAAAEGGSGGERPLSEGEIEPPP